MTSVSSVLPDDDTPLTLSSAPAPSAPASFPLASALVPVVGAVVLWAVTQSPYALWFAALGPLMALGAVWDARRTQRRGRRRARTDAAAERVRVTAEVAHRHAGERAQRWARHPDLQRYAADPAEIWRAVPGREEMIVVGSGEAASTLRVGGGDGDADAGEVRRAARVIAEVPVTVPVRAGIAVVGPPIVAAAVVRALTLQVLCMLPPADARLRVEPAGPWDGAPHRDTVGGRTVWLGEPGDAVPDGADIPIVRVAPGAPPPPRCGAVLTMQAAGRARLDHGGTTTEVRIEAASRDQTVRMVAALAARAEASLGRRSGAAPTLAALLDEAPDGAAGLAAAIGVAERGTGVVDLVADGPHAVVVGVTGSGKSELLTSWIVALAAHAPPSRVTFLLVDFKGGRAFDPLRALPHVTGVVSDLDMAGAVRAVESLRAELLHRERVLADAGARDLADRPDLLPRLVVVVDEFAALAAAHPAVHDLFADIVARGRALGVHAVLASQRAAGAFREGVLANAPLRIALRVTDPGDSRTVLGSDAAARLSGRPADLGVALVRRAGDDAPTPVRIARATPELIASVAAREPDTVVRRPWLPALPARIPLARLAVPGRIVLGVADEPARQRQPIVDLPEGAGLAVLGRAGSGRSTVLHAIAAQAAAVHRVGSDPETAWDAIAALDEAEPGGVVLVDDLDLLLARLPADHAAAARDRLELLARDGRARGIRLAVTAQRPTAAVARIVDLLPERILLAHAGRADLVAAGGDAADHAPDAGPGRAVWARRTVQLAYVDPPAPTRTRTPSPWHPHGEDLVGLVVPSATAGAAVLAAWERVAVLVAEAVAGTRGVLVGSAEQWVAHWRTLTETRDAGVLVIDAACAADFRAVTGIRDLPPYAAPGSGWLVRDGAVRRIRLPR
ncbi:FtsK/SpoIIIE domain-containing protein [Microbacterium telephonicum]|uniref:S-DNA-T family DNA segregation ATPase FtsK/SpoIIIE n=1 Tax=Microbacterium telephonicum TaxID=1714841 RepID=A0A498BX69_9MICO|nr:FtsK/SpoIIIE domain-containing protein [Microbacterium telephonicum]RLK47569.1 S-DNA-T family DNA segregation ATPase FtsK/SpoIIIE [Microbacterium telephonicum]